jgi:SAM-dependent methyltransferase
MRRQLWRAVTTELPPGSRLLDLGCGTGLDAAYLGMRGYRVVATDWSTGMVERTRARIAALRLEQAVDVQAYGAHQLDRLSGERFDGVYADLGSLNCVPDLVALARTCAELLRPGGRMIASVIGRRCPWEVLYYVFRGNGRRARLRNAAGSVPVSLNGRRVWTRYYTPREFYAPFAAEFELVWYRGLGVLLPPPYLIHWYDRLSPAFLPLGWLDDRVGSLPLLRDTGDHFLTVMSRRDRDG